MRQINLLNILTRIFSTKLFFIHIALVLLQASLIFCSFKAVALQIINDEEVEATIKQMAIPIILAAGIQPEEIRFYLVLDPSINAFVYGGRNIFINTGLITLFNDPDVLKGVIAHELGHITGAHIARREEQIKRLMPQFIFTNLLGVAAALTGAGSVGGAIMHGSSHTLERSMLRNSRESESSADQAAFRYLYHSHNSINGLLKLLQYFYQASKTFDQNNQYAQTHPVSNERITALKYYEAKFPDNYQSSLQEKKDYGLVVAKLRGFVNQVNTILQYNQHDLDEEARKYELTIALFRKANMNAALVKINELITHEPQNPYFYELKGQILFESGRVSESVAIYKTAVKLAPKAYLIKLEYAIALINYATRKQSLELNEAIAILHSVAYKQPDNPLVYHNLAIAYGKLEKLDYSNLMLAQEAVLQNNYTEAKKFIYNAKKYATNNKKMLLKIEDVEKLMDHDN